MIRNVYMVDHEPDCEEWSVKKITDYDPINGSPLNIVKEETFQQCWGAVKHRWVHVEAIGPIEALTRGMAFLINGYVCNNMDELVTKLKEIEKSVVLVVKNNPDMFMSGNIIGRFSNEHLRSHLESHLIQWDSTIENIKSCREIFPITIINRAGV
jgi:hypothetical protein